MNSRERYVLEFDAHAFAVHVLLALGSAVVLALAVQPVLQIAAGVSLVVNTLAFVRVA